MYRTLLVCGYANVHNYVCTYSSICITDGSIPMISQLTSFKVKYDVLRLLLVLHGIIHKVQITIWIEPPLSYNDVYGRNTKNFDCKYIYTHI